MQIFRGGRRDGISMYNAIVHFQLRNAMQPFTFKLLHFPDHRLSDSDSIEVNAPEKRAAPSARAARSARPAQLSCLKSILTINTSTYFKKRICDDILALLTWWSLSLKKISIIIQIWGVAFYCVHPEGSNVVFSVSSSKYEVFRFISFTPILHLIKSYWLFHILLNP